MIFNIQNKEVENIYEERKIKVVQGTHLHKIFALKFFNGFFPL